MTPNDSSNGDYVMPNSRRVYVPGELHPNIHVPFREISLAPTKSLSGELEPNEPIRVYDTSGPWGDDEVQCDVEQGLPALRADWIRSRGDVEEYEGRVVRPQDDGYLSEAHAAHAKANVQRPTFNVQRQW
jgi:phosphomethylpyrimidine synthase